MSYCTLHTCYAELQTHTEWYRSMSPTRTSRVVYGRITRRPSFEGAAARLNELSHSSHALPAPKPRPTKAGHARRLKRRTEKMTPKETPRPERMSIEERQRSHFSLSRASLMGRVVREMDATGWGLFSAMAADISSAIDGCNGALGVLRGEWERLDEIGRAHV